MFTAKGQFVLPSDVRFERASRLISRKSARMPNGEAKLSAPFAAAPVLIRLPTSTLSTMRHQTTIRHVERIFPLLAKAFASIASLAVAVNPLQEQIA